MGQALRVWRWYQGYALVIAAHGSMPSGAYRDDERHCWDRDEEDERERRYRATGSDRSRVIVKVIQAPICRTRFDASSRPDLIGKDTSI